MTLRHRVLGLPVAPGPPPGPVTFGTVGPGSSVGGTNTTSCLHTVGPDETILLVGVAAGINGSKDVALFTRSCLYGDQPMTSIGAYNTRASGTLSGFVELFYLLYPPPGSDTITVNDVASGVTLFSLIVGSVSYEKCGGIGVPVFGRWGIGVAPSLTVVSTDEQIVVAVFCSGNTIATPTDRQRVLTNRNASTSAGNLLIEDQDGAASSVLGYAANADIAAGIAVALQAAVPIPPPPVPLAPTITSIAPNPGAAGAVVINGTDFIAGATVDFGGTPGTGITVVNSAVINVTAPAHAAGDVDVTVTTSNGTSNICVFTYQAYTPDPDQVQFRGDYVGGALSYQWPWVDVAGYSGPTSSYLPAHAWSMQIQTDATYGYRNRVELRNGDLVGSSQRAELAANSGNTPLAGGGEGDTRWYEMGFMFDANFPANHASLGWGLVQQWKTPGYGSPGMGWYVDHLNDYFSLMINKQDTPGHIISSYSLLDLPLNRGVWHHISMKVVLSTSDAVGLVECWHNQVRQTFNDSSTTHHVRTMVPGADAAAVFSKQGYYRAGTITPTGTVYYGGFRCCYTSAGLTRPVS